MGFTLCAWTDLSTADSPLVTNCMLIQKEITYLWAEIAMNRSHTDLEMTSTQSHVDVIMPRIVCEAHGDAFKDSVERDGQDHQEAPESSLDQ